MESIRLWHLLYHRNHIYYLLYIWMLYIYVCILSISTCVLLSGLRKQWKETRKMLLVSSPDLHKNKKTLRKRKRMSWTWCLIYLCKFMCIFCPSFASPTHCFNSELFLIFKNRIEYKNMSQVLLNEAVIRVCVYVCYFT